jgi:branched-chain amino acid aminotransferase
MMTEVSVHSWFNGQVGPLEQGSPSVASISFHLGTGVFDGMMAYWNGNHYYLHRIEDHLVRFREGAARLGLPIPWTIVELSEAISELLAVEPKGTQYIRPIAYRGGPELWVTGAEGRPVDVSIFTVKTDLVRDLDKAMSCHISPVERISSRSIPKQTKVSGAYVNSLYARRTAELQGFDDGLMFDREGRLAEASAANVFLLRDDSLLTPPLNPDVFPGITRKVIFELAASAGIGIQEQNIAPIDLERADGVLLCSTLMEIRALDRIGDHLFNTLELPAFKRILTDFRRLTHS